LGFKKRFGRKFFNVEENRKFLPLVVWRSVQNLAEIDLAVLA